MKKNSLKIFEALFFLSFSFFLYGNENFQEKPFFQDFSVGTNKMISVYNASASIDLKNSWNLFLSGNFFFWKSQMQKLDLGVLPTAGSQTNVRGDVINMKFKFNPVFKAALGMNFNYDDWNILAIYTWLHQKKSTNVKPLLTTKKSVTLWRSFGNILANDCAVTDAKEKWGLKLNLIDIELGRSYSLGPHLTLKSHFGLRGTIIDQKLIVPYINNTVITIINTNQDSWSIGIRTGFEAHYLFGAGFRLLEEGFLSLSYQDFEVQIEGEQYNDTFTLHGYYEDDFSDFMYNPELRIGLGWGTYFAENSSYFDIALFYAFQMFSHQNMLNDLMKITNKSRDAYSFESLFFQELTITLSFDF